MSKKIKSQTILRIEHIPGELPVDYEERSKRHSHQEFDDQGNLLVEINYSSEGDMTDKSEFRYDEKGRLMETIIYDENEEVLERKVASRDAEGRMLREEVFYLDGSVDTYHYFYDEEGQMTALEVVDDEDSTEYTESYSYEDGKLVKTERFDENGNVTFRQEDTYVNGQLSERKIWSDEETESYTLVHRFNERGLREQELRYNSKDQLIERNIFEDDGTGRIVRIIEENKLRKNTTDFSFDDQGRLVHQVECDINGAVNHEVNRNYDEEGRVATVMVDMMQRPSGQPLTYTLTYLYTYHN
jgi:antitoxin component YwqK of YwqJK toxin-antitoxin module